MSCSCCNRESVCLLFGEIEAAPADPILGIRQLFLADENPGKVDLSVGLYQDDHGQTLNLQVVQDVQASLLSEAKESGYLPINGFAPYNKQIRSLLFGENSQVLRDKRVVTAQSLGGTGALRCGADFLKRYFPDATVYISSPTWPNHRAIFQCVGFSVEEYPYYDCGSHTVNFEAMHSALSLAAAGSIVLLHACCHNPTGLDLSREQWASLIELCKERQLIAFIDFAYQGFAEGIEEDAFAVRMFADSGLSFLVSNSFSKNFSLYRRRVGALSVVCASEDEASKVLSQLKIDARRNYSNPPIDGALIVSHVLGDPALRKRWEEEVTEMRERMKVMRQRFVDLLEKKGKGDALRHLLGQNGMFSFTGLTKEQVIRLRDERSVYLVESGRMCVAAINQNNVEYLASAVAGVLE